MSENVIERAWETLQNRYDTDEGCGCGPEGDELSREFDSGGADERTDD